MGTTLPAAISGGVLFHGTSVFFIPIRRELGLSVAQTSLIFTSSRALSGVGGPLFGWMSDRYGGRPRIIVGGLPAGLGLIYLQTLRSYIPFLLA